MVTNTGAGVIKASISGGEVLALLNAAGIKPVKASPLAGITGQPSPIDTLRASGLLDNNSQVTPAAREALGILANPASEMDMLWGNPDGISLSSVYAAAGQDKFVSFTGMNGKYNFSFFLGFNDFMDLIAQKVAFTEVKDSAALELEIPPAALPVLFAALDAYRESQLKAALERRPELLLKVTADDLNRIIQESKLETNYSWYTPVDLMTLPPEAAITETAVAAGLKTIQSTGLISKEGELSDTLATFAYRAFPLAGFIGIKLICMNGTIPEKTQLSIFRGLSTLLLVQMTEKNTVQVSSISTSELPELMLNLGIRQQEAPPPPVSQPSTAGSMFCTKCGTANTGASKFCSKCGTPLTAPTPAARFCTKCGAQVADGEKFCKKCGTPVK